MRSALLLSALATFGAVSAFPAKDTDCTCVNVVTSTTTLLDRTAASKTTALVTSTLSAKTKEVVTVTTTTTPYTSTETQNFSTTETSTIVESASPSVNGLYKIKPCNCPHTSVQTKTKTEHGTVTTPVTVTKTVKETPAEITITSTKVKGPRKSAVSTDTIYNTHTFSANVTSTASAPYDMGNSTTIAGPTGTGGTAVPVFSPL